MFAAGWSVLNPLPKADFYNKQTTPVCFSLLVLDEPSYLWLGSPYSHESFAHLSVFFPFKKKGKQESNPTQRWGAPTLLLMKHLSFTEMCWVHRATTCVPPHWGGSQTFHYFLFVPFAVLSVSNCVPRCLWGYIFFSQPSLTKDRNLFITFGEKNQKHLVLSFLSSAAWLRGLWGLQTNVCKTIPGSGAVITGWVICLIRASV